MTQTFRSRLLQRIPLLPATLLLLAVTVSCGGNETAATSTTVAPDDFCAVLQSVVTFNLDAPEKQAREQLFDRFDPAWDQLPPDEALQKVRALNEEFREQAREWQATLTSRIEELETQWNDSAPSSLQPLFRAVVEATDNYRFADDGSGNSLLLDEYPYLPGFNPSDPATQDPLDQRSFALTEADEEELGRAASDCGL